MCRAISRIITFIIILISFSLASEAASFNRIVYPTKTKDASGYELKQDQAPKRIICASPAVAEILFSFNIEDRIVGITKNCDYPEGVKQIEKVGDKKMEKNKVVKLKPDLVLVSLPDYSSAELGSLRNNRFMTTVTFETWTGEISTEVREVTLEVFAIDPQNLQEVLDMISTLGTITNREHAAYSLLERMKRRMDWVNARAKKEKPLKGIVLMSKRPVKVAASGTYFADLMKVAGILNVAPVSKEQYPKMDRKQIEKADPDVVISSLDVARNPKDIYNNRNFRRSSVGKSKKVACIDKDIFYRKGPRLVDAIEQIANSVYGWDKNENVEK